jgi:non-ribosomal peptide synthetase component F
VVFGEAIAWNFRSLTYLHISSTNRPGVPSSLLEQSAGEFPDRAALVNGSTRVTYSEVNNAANRVVANLLVSCGIKPGR